MIHEDTPSDRVAELRPSVKRYRKSHRPKQDRCATHRDERYSTRLFRKGPGEAEMEDTERQALSELPELAKHKIFMKGTDDAHLDFRIEIL